MIGTIGEIRLFAGDYAPVHWEFCHGQILPVNGNQILFSILGARYGGDGTINFALPDCRGRLTVGTGQGVQFYENQPWVVLSAYYLGKTGGSETTTVGALNLPIHDHPISGTVTMPSLAAAGNSDSPTGHYPAILSGKNMYATAHNNLIMAPMQFDLKTDQKGGSQPVHIIQPVLGLTYIICIAGLFPERP